MVVATQYPTSEGVGGQKKKSSAAEHFPMVKPSSFGSRTVLAYAAERVDEVRAHPARK
jgi:hypothetical protein